MTDEISPINKHDIPKLVELINLSYRNDMAGAWTTEAHLFNEGGLRIDATELMSTLSLPCNHILKYEINEQIFGTVTLTENKEAIYIGTLAVAPESQGMGIGKKFLQYAKDFAIVKKKKKVLLTVISIRQELIQWYERFGFKKTGTVTPFPKEIQKLSTPTKDLFFEEMVFHI